MIPEGLDPVVISKITYQQVEQVTCIECCKYYIAPTTATCGHTLCHGCWIGRRSCPICAAPLNRIALKLNLPLQKLTEHVHVLGDAFEKISSKKLNEFVLDIDEGKIDSDPTKHVKDWLASSLNHFSAPGLSSQLTIPDVVNPMELSANKIQIHTHVKKTELIQRNQAKARRPSEKIDIHQHQEDWDKIEILPDIEDNLSKDKENVVGPMDIEPFFIEDNEYTTENPRRSSRKRDNKHESQPQTRDTSVDRHSSKNSSGEADKKSTKAKQNWSNVKNMRKEFSKLNKKNRNKLNVSIEMCKKTQNIVNRPQIMTSLVASQQPAYVIDDNTPDVINSNKEMATRISSESLTIRHDDRNETPVKKTANNNNDSKYINEPSKSTDESKSRTDLQCKENSSFSKFISSESLTIRYDDRNQTPVKKTAYNDDDNKCTNKPFKSTNESETQSDLQRNENSSFSKNSDKTSKRNELTVVNRSSVHNDVLLPEEIETETMHMPCFKKSTLHHQKSIAEENVRITQKRIDPSNCVNSDDISISIRVGNTVTNIVIKKKENDVQLKVNTDREIQTSLGPYALPDRKDASCSPVKQDNIRNAEVPEVYENKIRKMTPVSKSTSVKKNTDSADTATAHFEITDSVDRELSDLMECVETENAKNVITSPLKTHKVAMSSQVKDMIKVTHNKAKQNANTASDEQVNDLDIFGSGSVKEGDVHLLINARDAAPSEILMPTLKNKKSQKVADKRGIEDAEVSCNKKQKINYDIIEEVPLKDKNKEITNESGNMCYDAIMSQVFANIDADIKGQNSQNKQPIKNIESTKKLTETIKSQKSHNHNVNTKETEIDNVSKKDLINQKYSENVFSMMDKDSESTELTKGDKEDHIKKLLTPGICRNLVSSTRDDQSEIDDVEMIEPDLATPVMDHDDSDKSIVEETPQKNLSFSKVKQKTDQTNNEKQPQKNNSDEEEKRTVNISSKSSDSQIIKSIINISDSLEESSKNKDNTVLEKKKSHETPLTINKFFDHIKHNSTPMARKSLNFNNENLDDAEETLCPTGAKETQEQTLCPTTTQEKEFLAKAFEPTPKSPVKRTLGLKSTNRDNKKLCLAGSCLTVQEQMAVKALCSQRNWNYVDKYTTEITHLVVGVDEDNKSQRSVKYMCALAASKWIVSYAWIEICVQTKGLADESLYEALDGSGDPGPRLSRVAQRKLFEGFAFYCMPPFSILDVDTLKYILEAAGGRVVNDIQMVKVTSVGTPSLLLAEPEHTQEDRFIYLAMELSVVPVNYEWVLNCLGTYSLGSLHDLLLCPSTLLPPVTNQWPASLLLRENDSHSID